MNDDLKRGARSDGRSDERCDGRCDGVDLAETRLVQGSRVEFVHARPGPLQTPLDKGVETLPVAAYNITT